MMRSRMDVMSMKGIANATRLNNITTNTSRLKASYSNISFKENQCQVPIFGYIIDQQTQDVKRSHSIVY